MRRLQLLFVWALMLFCGVQVAKAQKVGIFVEETGLDDDEQAALEWFKTTYSDGIVYTPSTINDLSIDAVKALWIPVDRVGGAIPNDIKNASSIIASYVKAGGNLLLTNHATQLIVDLGRVDETYKPTIIGSGVGGDNPDTWGINAMIGCNPDLPNHYDHHSHDIYNGLEENTEQYSDHTFFPLIGSGWKEDHNCMWDFNGIAGLGDNPNKLVDFENKTNSSVIGTWQHVTDYACAGVIEFKPNGDFKGTILCNGIAAYEWNQNSGTNQYQSNIEKLTSNSLDYLKGLGNTLASTKAPITVDGKASYWGTFYSSKAKTLPAGVTAYIVSSATNKSAKLTKVAETGQVIPGENGYLLSTEEKQDEMYLTDADANQAVKIIGENLLKGSDEESTVSEDGYTYYILGKQEDNYGFYWQADSENGSKVTNAAHKAYLQIQKATDGNEAKFLSFTFGDGTTSIKGIAVEQAEQDATLYNLAGQRINKGYKGLVIKNGNKYMAK